MPARAEQGLRCLVVAALPLINMSCGALPRFSGEDVECRSLVTADGEQARNRVTWAYIESDEDRQFQNAWCAGVGPAVLYAPPRVAETAAETVAGAAASAAEAVASDTVAMRPAPPARALPVLDSLLVVSYNAHIGLGDIEALVSDTRAGALTGEPVEHFVLLVQEAFRAAAGVPEWEDLPPDVPGGSRLENAPPAEEDIVNKARELGLYLFYAPSMRNGAGQEVPQDRGNAILSTLPLHALRAMELPAGIQRRVAVQATVVAQDSEGVPWQLHVVSAHLDNASGSRPIASFGTVRGDQAEGLTRMVSAEGATVVGGDFNTWFLETAERAYRRMRHHFPLPRTHQTEPTVTRLGTGRVIDYLFFRGPAGWTFDDQRADSPYGSDHYPLYGWVGVGPGRVEADVAGEVGVPADEPPGRREPVREEAATP